MKTNLDRKNFKDLTLGFVNYFTNIIVKRLSTFGYNGALVWCSDRLSPNTHVVIVRNMGFLHLISDFNIVSTIKLLPDENY